MTRRYQFRCYNEKDEFLGVHVEDHHSLSDAIASAIILTEQDGGPVEIANSGDTEWEDRFLVKIEPRRS